MSLARNLFSYSSSRRGGRARHALRRRRDIPTFSYTSPIYTMVVHCVLATVSRFCEIVNVMADPRRIRERSPIHVKYTSPLDTAPEVFLVVVVAVYATVPEQGESAAGRSSQASQDVAVQSAERAPTHDTCAPATRRSPRLHDSSHPARPRPRPFSWRTYRASRGRSTPSSSGSRCQGGYTHRTESRRHVTDTRYTSRAAGARAESLTREPGSALAL